MSRVSWSLVVLIVVISTAISLFVIADSPLPARADLPTDDGLFIRLAGSLRARDWLGSFDQLTLAKGPAYPAVIALADAMSIQLKVAEQLLYLLAALLLAWVVSRLTSSRLVGALLFATLALIPYFFLDDSLRVLRESVYTGASVAVVGGVAWVFLVRLADPHPWRGRDVVVGCVIGTMVGFYWLVREEGVWLAPSLAVLAAGGLLVVLLRARSGASKPSDTWTEAPLAIRPRRAIIRTATAAIAILLGASLVVATVAFLNLRNYGVPLVNDFRDGTFPAAVGAFSRVGAVDWHRYIPAVRESRLAVYRNSPAAAELEAFLERPDYFYRQIGCEVAASSVFVRDRSIEAPCDEFYYGWFPWALRDAIAAAGHWDSASEAQAFMARLADEINAACDSQRIQCGPTHDSITPPLRSQFIGEVLGLLPFGFQVLTDMRDEVGGAQSRGDIPELSRFARVTHSSIAAPALGEADLNHGVRLSGRVDSSAGTPNISVQRTAVGVLDVSQQVEAVDNLVGTSGTPGVGDSPARASIRFTLQTSCLEPDCSLVVLSDGQTMLSTPLDFVRSATQRGHRYGDALGGGGRALCESGAGPAQERDPSTASPYAGARASHRTVIRRAAADPLVARRDRHARGAAHG